MEAAPGKIIGNMEALAASAAAEPAAMGYQDNPSGPLPHALPWDEGQGGLGL